MFVLDTNSWIYFFKGQGRVAEHLLSTPPRQIGIPAIVLYELEVGIAKSQAPEKRRRQLDQVIKNCRLLPFGHEEAKVGGPMRAKLELAGKVLGPLDMLIAATALSQKAPLVTHNLREFRRVEDLELLDWYAE